jgi:hypothetical protein
MASCEHEPMARTSRTLGLAACVLLASAVAVGCGDAGPSRGTVDAMELPGVWEAKVEKPFEKDDPEKLVFAIEHTGAELIAHACTLDHRDGDFDGPIISFRCEEASAPVTYAADALEIHWREYGVRLRIEERLRQDTLAGSALVDKWSELGETPFTATRVPPSALPP